MGGVYGGIMNAGGASGGLGALNGASNETPGGVINGVNATFTLAHNPNPANSTLLIKNRIAMLLTTDYTVGASSITYQAGSIPQTGDIHVISYTY